MTRDGVTFDYIAKEGKRRTITITDEAIRAVVRALIRSDNGLGPAVLLRARGTWRPLRSHQVSNYIANRAGGHFTAKEFRTWNATVLMALLLANADPAPTARSRKSTIIAGVRGVADWLGDTPAVARSSYIDPRVISRYESDGELPAIPRLPAVLPAAAKAEIAVAALLAADGIEPSGSWPSSVILNNSVSWCGMASRKPRRPRPRCGPARLCRWRGMSQQDALLVGRCLGEQLVPRPVRAQAPQHGQRKPDPVQRDAVLHHHPLLDLGWLAAARHRRIPVDIKAVLQA